MFDPSTSSNVQRPAHRVSYPIAEEVR